MHTTVDILVLLLGSCFSGCLILDYWLNNFPGSLVPYSQFYYQWTLWLLISFWVSYLVIMQTTFFFVVELGSPSKIAVIFIHQISWACLLILIKMGVVDYWHSLTSEGWEGGGPCSLIWVASHSSQSFIFSYSLWSAWPHVWGGW